MSPAGLVLLAFVWSALVWAGACLICRLKPSPQMAQTVWRAAALALAAPFAASLIVPGLPLPDNTPLPDLPMFEPLMVVPQEGVTVAAQAPGLRLPEPGVLVIGLVAAGWLVRFGLWLVSEVRLQRLKTRAMRTHRPIGHWAEAVGLRATPQVHVIPHGAPFLAGIFKRSVYVPSALIGGEGAQQVIVHELVHLRRGDLVARPLERMVADLFWFSPFAWWIRNELDFWREAVVDEETVGLTGDRIAYARTLASAARVSRIGAVLPVAAFTLRKKGTLKMRLNEILAEAPRRPRRTGLVLAVALACAAPLALAQGMLIKGAAAAPGNEIVYGHAVLDKATLTSAFGERIDPFTKKTAMHRGVDLAAARGTPAYAPAAGTVIFAGEKEGYGNAVDLMIGNDTVLRYGQLDTLSVEEGQVLKAGDEVGGVGTSGRSTGPHLHFEVWRGGELTDPWTEKGLELADSLLIMASSGVNPPPAPVPLEAVPALAAVPAPPAPPEMPDACKTFDAWLAAPDTSAAWASRKAASKEANKAAGLSLDANWIPETVTHPAPYYPPGAASSVKSGACVVMFDLGTDGLPKNAAAECTDPVFADSAAQMNQASFKPALGPDGKPVEVKGIIYPMSYCVEG